MNPGLPSTLRAAVDQLCLGVSGRLLAERAEELSAVYRSGGGSKSALPDHAGRLAYLTTRMPATFAAVSAALAAVSERLGGFAPASLLDLGAGPGTAAWAAAELLPALADITLVEALPAFRDLARTLAGASAVPALARAVIRDGRLPECAGDLRPAGLVIASYLFGELPKPHVAAAIDAAWQATTGVLLLVEPGTPRGYHLILAARARLIAAGAEPVAPCPSAAACPIIAPDWCHFSVRLPRLKAHMQAKAADLPYEDEKFAYLAVRRPGGKLPDLQRILSAPVIAKHEARLRLCGPGGLTEVTLPSREKTPFQAARKAGWGGTWPDEAKSPE